jgi:threonylcarbamoyladenosine tRNA methylthiotransferase MtaB
MKAAFYTLGCKVNQYETGAMEEMFRNRGFDVVRWSDKADIYVVNTCTVTAESDKKSRQIASRIRTEHPQALVALVGCYPQTADPSAMQKVDADIIMGTAHRSQLIDHVMGFLSDRKKRFLVNPVLKASTFEELRAGGRDQHTRAMLKIQDGCNNFCSYCIIPYTRGPIRSRKPEFALAEAARFTSNGYREIVLTGIHLTSYGKDLGMKSALSDLIANMDDISGLERLRLGSIEPTLITEDFIAKLSSCRCICPHFHIPLQSGSEKTLLRMNRKYDLARYKLAVESLRSAFPMCSITTDMMVGFPGETSLDFEHSLFFAEEMAFSKIHVFVYSRRHGTAAVDFPDQVDPSTSKKRAKALSQLSDRLQVDYHKSFIGKALPVLFEQPNASNMAQGYSNNYIFVEAPHNRPESVRNQIQNILITGASTHFCQGQISSDKQER